MYSSGTFKGLAHYSNGIYGDGLFSSTYSTYVAPVPPPDNFILQDNGDFLLQDNGDKIIVG